MIPFLADYCCDEDIVRAVIRRNPSIDFVLARDEGLHEAEDPRILAWAAREGRVVITFDRNTMIAFALERIRHRQPMTGVVVHVQGSGAAEERPRPARRAAEEVDRAVEQGDSLAPLPEMRLPRPFSPSP